jgi:hypothetical protein
MPKAEGMARIGLELADVTTDWGLRRLELQALRGAAYALLSGDLDCCRDLVRSAQARAADRGKSQPEVWRAESRLTAEGVATAFGLCVRRQAALIELRWAALAESRVERVDHLRHAAERLEACGREESSVDALAQAIRSAPSCGFDLAAPPAPTAPPARRVNLPRNPTDGDAA